jgi:hypothetical protein
MKECEELEGREPTSGEEGEGGVAAAPGREKRRWTGDEVATQSRRTSNLCHDS